MNNELERCIKFIELNGWEFSFSQDTEDIYDKEGCLSISFSEIDNEIVFLSDNGDVYHIKPNIYTLLGYLFQHHQIDCSYKFVYHQSENRK